MSKLQPIEVDGAIIYLETQDVEVPEVVDSSEGEQSRVGKSGNRTVETQVVQSFQLIESTIKTYTKHTLNAFRDAALADVEKVTLEFGLNVSGSSGVPFVAAGTMGCNIKVTVECAFPKRQPQMTAQQAAAQRAAQAGVPPQAAQQRSPQPGMPPQPLPMRTPPQ
jgi:hypothetical protein